MTDRPTHTRRDALLAGAAALAGSAFAGTALARPSRAARSTGIRTRTNSSQPAHARNVIFMVSDGMSHGTLTLADLAIRKSTGQRCAWMRLWDRPGVRRALQDTAAADSIVTDSSAAASAWGIGERINNGAVNFTPDRRAPEPLLVTAKARGKATALVTTARVTHATPAGFIANVPDRGMEPAIAEQIQRRGVDVVLGGGRVHFSASTLVLRDVELATDRQTLAGAPGGLARPLLGLFQSGHINYVIERPDTQPTLETMTRAALDRLAGADNGFVMQIEGARVDHAAHSNDAAAMLAEQIEFDRTIQVVADWTSDRDDTLVVITSDHGNANPGMTVYGQDAARGLDRLMAARISSESILATASAGAGGDGSALIEQIVALVAQHRGIEFGQRERQIMADALAGSSTNPFAPQNNWTSLLGALLANYYGVSFLSPNHTADHVECTAYGPGSEHMPAYLLNTDLYRLMIEALELVPG